MQAARYMCHAAQIPPKVRTRPEKLAESGSPLAAAVAAAALDWARFAQAGRLRTLKLPGRALKLESDGATEPAGCVTGWTASQDRYQVTTGAAVRICDGKSFNTGRAGAE